jgi:arylsulfatase A-like enzyme
MKSITIKTVFGAVAGVLLGIGQLADAADQAGPPNIILCMTDDQGWGDVSYNGLKHIQTPNLDAMSKAGVRFDRFYAAHPSCSPTRASVMTGRHPFRAGLFWPGMPLRAGETTIAHIVKRAGYRSGHFGKWHLSGGKPGGGRALPDSDPLHPGQFGFDEWFTVSNWFDTDWTYSRKGQPVMVPGDGSDAIVAEAVKFIKAEAAKEKPFLAVIWFGSPHIPLKPTEADLKAAGGSAYYGEMIGVDRSMGALRQALRDLGIAENTLLWFNSDNGAWEEADVPADTFGSNGPLRGRKGELWEAGIRVPGMIEWPARIKRPFVSNVPVVTSDIFATIVDVLGVNTGEKQRPLDGISLVPLLERRVHARPSGIGFWHPEGDNTFSETRVAWIDNRYKLHKRGTDTYELYDLQTDLGETTNLVTKLPDIVSRMASEMSVWQGSVRRSFDGKD